MDPLTAISLAGTIITFVDFASEIFSGASELYHSKTGRTTRNVHIENVITDLQDAADDLEAESLGNSREAKRLKRLASNCNKLAEELLEVLKGLRLDGNKNRLWGSLIAKWKNVQKTEKVKDMEERLREYRAEMMLQVSILISNHQSSLNVKLDSMKAEAAQLQSQTVRELDSIRDRIQQSLIRTEKIAQSYKIDSERYSEILELLEQMRG